MSLNDKIKKYNCPWLKDYLKELIRNRDFKTYNRIKCVLYYFPNVLMDASLDDLKIVMQYADDSYVCLGTEDIRYTAFDKIYKEKYGNDFNPSSFGETRYITIDEICKHFGL
jgi:hypothetical protein